MLAHPGGRPEDYLHSGTFWQAVGVGALSGAAAGAIGFWIGGVAAGTGLGAIAGGVLSGAATGAAGQVTVNLLTPCVDWHDNVAEAAIFGGLIGVIAEDAGYGTRQRMANQRGTVSSRLFSDPCYIVGDGQFRLPTGLCLSRIGSLSRVAGKISIWCL